MKTWTPYTKNVRCKDCGKLITCNSIRCKPCFYNSRIGKIGHKGIVINLGSKNGMWKGNEVSYKNLHGWIRRHKPKVELCENCNKEKSYDVANISGKYKRDINDYEWLCRRCHMKGDGRMKNLEKGREILLKIKRWIRNE